MNVYKKAKVAYEMMGKERAKAEIPEIPLNRMFLISGNNTGTGILQNIMDNNGTGLICETEADTISTAIGSEYGHWSETLRRAFDHDWLAYNRRTNQEYRENKKSYLSLLLSGTPAQVKPLIPSVENGLFHASCSIICTASINGSISLTRTKRTWKPSSPPLVWNGKALELTQGTWSPHTPAHR